MGNNGPDKNRILAYFMQCANVKNLNECGTLYIRVAPPIFYLLVNCLFCIKPSLKFCVVHTASILKYVWLFFDIKNKLIVTNSKTEMRSSNQNGQAVQGCISPILLRVVET